MGVYRLSAPVSGSLLSSQPHVAPPRLKEFAKRCEKKLAMKAWSMASFVLKVVAATGAAEVDASASFVVGVSSEGSVSMFNRSREGERRNQLRGKR